MNAGKSYLVLLIPLSLTGCAIYPHGPSMLVLPGLTATFDQFRTDEMNCKVYAEHAVAGQSTQQAAEAGAINSAAAGTVVGAAAGAMIGAASGNAGSGAAIGAGSGLILGSAAGSDAYAVSGSRTQARYDNAYVQCMYARGHQVPVPASLASAHRSRPAPVSAPTSLPLGSGSGPPVTAAYPPPGMPPPPGY